MCASFCITALLFRMMSFLLNLCSNLTTEKSINWFQLKILISFRLNPLKLCIYHCKQNCILRNYWFHQVFARSFAQMSDHKMHKKNKINKLTSSSTKQFTKCCTKSFLSVMLILNYVFLYHWWKLKQAFCG